LITFHLYLGILIGKFINIFLMRKVQMIQISSNSLAV